MEKCRECAQPLGRLGACLNCGDNADEPRQYGDLAIARAGSRKAPKKKKKSRLRMFPEPAKPRPPLTAGKVAIIIVTLIVGIGFGIYNHISSKAKAEEVVTNFIAALSDLNEADMRKYVHPDMQSDESIFVPEGTEKGLITLSSIDYVSVSSRKGRGRGTVKATLSGNLGNGLDMKIPMEFGVRKKGGLFGKWYIVHISDPYGT